MPASPDLVIDAILGFTKTAAVSAAVELDLFTEIGAGAQTIPALAARTQASERGIRALADYLVVLGLLTKDGESYGLAEPSAAFLDRRSPMFLGSVTGFLAAPEMTALSLTDPAGNVRRGGADGRATATPDNPLWVRFAESMVPFMGPAAAMTAGIVAGWNLKPAAILDVAAGHGMWGIALARQAPGAVVTAIDGAPVLDVARRNAAEAGLSERYRTLPGDAFEVPFGDSFDLVMMAHLLHHFDAPACIRLLEKAKAALAPGGRALLPEFVAGEDRVTPPFAGLFSYLMLNNTPAGQAHTRAEFADMAHKAGFGTVEFVPLEPTPQTLIVLA
ncbi:class I SAM-dependent methyltransferase [Geminicoccus roseus]|uniref:class I SAM-dependent methyltransferase n=1 Tax=Geminicoccus roseus TaxID=404900 RepID=UPI0003FC60AE|nr:class I SAM-dependent methyltransferase [Geminicoccus roseus]